MSGLQMIELLNFQTCMEENAAEVGGASAGHTPMRSRMEALAGVMVLTRASGGLSIGCCWLDSFCVCMGSRFVPSNCA